MLYVIIKSFMVPQLTSGTGIVWRAFQEDGTPYYIGAETREELEQRVRECMPHHLNITFMLDTNA